MEDEAKSHRGWLLAAAIGVVVVFAMFYPPFRVLLLVSVPLGVVVALVLRWWYRRKPVELPEERKKRPLGLDEK